MSYHFLAGKLVNDDEDFIFPFVVFNIPVCTNSLRKAFLDQVMCTLSTKVKPLSKKRVYLVVFSHAYCAKLIISNGVLVNTTANKPLRSLKNDHFIINHV